MAKKAVSSKKIRPLMGYILIEPSSSEDVTSSGIYLPENAQEKPAQGKVIEVADHSPVNMGDLVVYKKWGSDDIKVEGKEYKLVKFEDLMAVIEGGK